MWRLANGHVIQTTEVKEWKRTAGLIARGKGAQPLIGDVRVAVILHPRMTKGGVASKRRLDLDNCLKLALDALNGVAYHDDRQVIAVAASVGQPMQYGGLSVSVEPLGADLGDSNPMAARVVATA